MKQIILALSVAMALSLSAACSSSGSSPTTSNGDGVSNITALQITDVKIGTGADATNGKLVTVHYTGWLYNETAADHHGAKFDSSRDRNQPFQFNLLMLLTTERGRTFTLAQVGAMLERAGLRPAASGGNFPMPNSCVLAAAA